MNQDNYLSHSKFRAFEKRVTEFLDSVRLEGKDRENIATEIVRLILQIQDGMGSNTLRRKTFRLDILDDFKFFKDQYLDMSFHIHRRLWQAVIRKVKFGIEPEHAVLAQDVAFCLRFLNDEDLQKVQALEIREELNVDQIDIGKFTTGEAGKKRKNLVTYAASKVYTLRFLTDYDPGLELNDFAQDLTVENIRVINSYGRSKGKNLGSKTSDIYNRVEAYVETAMNNKVNNIKEYHMCENRRRVKTTHEPLYKERAKLRKLVKKNPTREDLVEKLKGVEKDLKHTNSDYYTVVTPLVKNDDGEDRVIDVVDTKEDSLSRTLNQEFIVNTQKGVEEGVWLEDIILGLPSRLSVFVRIVIGLNVPEFETWAKQEGINTANPDSLNKGARKFCKVSTTELRSNPLLLDALSRS